MRIAFVGKGGSGKTTMAALFTRHLAALGHPVLAVDADINQNLAAALEVGSVPAALSTGLSWLKEHLRGANPLLHTADLMIKTTPPGRGSRLLTLAPDDEVLRRHAVPVPGGGRLMVTGEVGEEDIGVSCYHAKTGAVELYLNHLVDGPGEYVVVDMTAGADAFASGLFTRFDLTVLVSEPTRRGVGVYRQYLANSGAHRVRLRVVGNKVADDADRDYLCGSVGAALLATLGLSPWVRAAERGAPPPLEQLEPASRDALRMVHRELDATERDWVGYHRDTVDFHRRNALSWANASLGTDLTAQIDPDYVPGPSSAAVRA